MITKELFKTDINIPQNIQIITNSQGQEKVILDIEVWNELVTYLQRISTPKSALTICQQAGTRTKADIDNSLNIEREAWGE